MRHEHLLRLYPRPWRERYGEEFLSTLGEGPLHWQQVIDIVSGAIDAWLSSDVRRATTMASGVAPTGGGQMTVKSLLACEHRHAHFTTRDSLIGAGVMIAATLLLTIAGTVARQQGWAVAGEVLVDLSFMGALMLSLPFWLMKGQPWKAQAVIVGGTLTVLTAIAFSATLN